MVLIRIFTDEISRLTFLKLLTGLELILFLALFDVTDYYILKKYVLWPIHILLLDSHFYKGTVYTINYIFILYINLKNNYIIELNM